ncbi:MAG: hypothetical protein ACYCU7_09070 [Acidimicrobiales bacterium]
MTTDDLNDSNDKAPAAAPVAAVSSAPAQAPIHPSPAARVAGAVRKTALTTWEGIWYVLMCIGFGAGYFAKIPAKKALNDFGLVEMTSAELLLVRADVHRLWGWILRQDPSGKGALRAAAVPN